MSLRELKKDRTHKTLPRPNPNRYPPPSSKHNKQSPLPPSLPLFESGRLQHTIAKKQSLLSEQQRNKFQKKVVTTDESNNGQDSHLHESIFISDNKLPNQEYFHQPLTFKEKRNKVGGRRREEQGRKVQELSIKIGQMNQLVHSQQKQIKVMKNSMSERELHRLIKMHSIQKLKLLESMNVFKEGNSIKHSKRM